MQMPQNLRFQGWVALVVFSSVALGALIDSINRSKSKDNRSSMDNWVVACVSTSLAIATILSAIHLIGKAKKYLEAVAWAFMLFWWCAGIDTIMATSN